MKYSRKNIVFGLGHNDLSNFQLTNYLSFVFFMTIFWIDYTNPIISHSWQLIPKVNNSYIAIAGAWLTIPSVLKNIRLPFKPIIWALPFMLLITINLPFVDYSFMNSVKAVISTWIMLLIIFPILIRLLATPSGRLHFAIVLGISSGLLSLMVFRGLNSGDFEVGTVMTSYRQLSAGAITMLPISIGYIYGKHGTIKFFFIIILLVTLLTIIPSGNRSAWVILFLELLLMVFFVLPKIRLLSTSIIMLGFLFIILSLISPREFYNINVLNHFEKRLSKFADWRNDTSVWSRLGFAYKTKMILEEYPFLGVGYGNHSVANFDAGYEVVFGEYRKLGRRGMHNTIFRLLAGTGILGFTAVLYFLVKCVSLFLRLNIKKLIKRLDVGPFIVFIFGMLLNSMFTSYDFATILYLSSFVFGFYLESLNSGVVLKSKIT